MILVILCNVFMVKNKIKSFKMWIKIIDIQPTQRDKTNNTYIFFFYIVTTTLFFFL